MKGTSGKDLGTIEKEGDAILCWKGRIPWVIRPKKEYIKPCETCIANNLNLNDKGPSIE